MTTILLEFLDMFIPQLNSNHYNSMRNNIVNGYFSSVDELALELENAFGVDLDNLN